METEGLAIAVCGATRPCPNWRCGPPREGLPRTDDVCPDCQERGRIYILGERARKPCPYRVTFKPGWGLTEEAIAYYAFLHKQGECPCRGRGWLSAILLPDGRVDIGLLLDLLLEAGGKDLYTDIAKQDSGRQWTVRIGGTEGVGRDLSLVILQTVSGAFERHPEWWRGTDMLTEMRSLVEERSDGREGRAVRRDGTRG